MATNSLVLIMIEGYYGLPGSGKTYSMISRLVSFTHSKKNKKRPIYANMNLDIKRLRKLSGWQGTFYLLQDWSQLVEAHDGLIVLDELNLWMPSRVWAKVPGQLLWKWAQVRKSGLEIWYTSQSPKRVDKVVRELTFISYHMSSFKALGFFTAKCYAGIQDKFYCWNFIRFKKAHALVYDTKAFISVPQIYENKMQVVKSIPWVKDEYVPKPKKKPFWKRNKKEKIKEEYFDIPKKQMNDEEYFNQLIKDKLKNRVDAPIGLETKKYNLEKEKIKRVAAVENEEIRLLKHKLDLAYQKYNQEEKSEFEKLFPL